MNGLPPITPSLTRRSVLSSALALPALAHGHTRPKVVGLFSLPFDHLWVSRLHQPLQQAHARGEIEYRAFENLVQADYPALLRQHASQGCDLIFGESHEGNDAVRMAAKAFPAVSFVWWSLGKPQAPNFSVYENCIHEPCYLAGMVAASLSTRQHLGLIGGFALAHTLAMMNAFALGAQAVNPKIRISSGVVKSWYHPVRSTRMTQAMLDKGADTFLALTHAGVVETAVQHQALAFNCMANQQNQYPHTVVAAALWHPERMIQAVIERARTRSLRAETFAHYASMREGGSSLTLLFPNFAERIPAEVQARLNTRTREIKQGTFVVPRIGHMTLNTVL